jgi:hypothetical protein
MSTLGAVQRKLCLTESVVFADDLSEWSDEMPRFFSQLIDICELLGFLSDSPDLILPGSEYFITERFFAIRESVSQILHHF